MMNGLGKKQHKYCELRLQVCLTTGKNSLQKTLWGKRRTSGKQFKTKIYCAETRGKLHVNNYNRNNNWEI